MTQAHLQGVLPCLRRMLSPKESECVADGELLRRFVQQRDEAAFELLVWRHGRMVLHVCRRIMGDAHEAEDAFQATFLTLARRAASIRGQASVAGWLHKVAYRVALAARARAARRHAVEQPLFQTLAGNAPDPAAEAAWHEVARVLDVEVNRLGERFRLPLILCYLEGKTNAEAARELGCPVGTIESRLIRARERLRARLARRGLALSSSLLALALARASASAATPVVLVVTTTRSAALFAAGLSAMAGSASPKVFSLAEGALRTMLLSKIKIAALVAFLVIVAGASAGFLSRPVMAAWRPADKQATAPKQGKEAKVAAAQPAKESVEYGALEKIDLKEGAIVVQVQTQVLRSGPSNGFFRTFNDSIWIDSTRLPANYGLEVSQYANNWMVLPGTVSTNYGLEVSQYANNLTVLPYGTIWKGQRLLPLVQSVRRRLAPAVTVVIDSREAKLTDLISKIGVQVTLNKDSLVTRIEANGSTMNDCLVDSLDPVKHRLAVGHHGNPYQYEIARDVQIVVNGRPSKLADVKPEMPVSLQFSALKPAIIGIKATGPLVECVLKGVDAEHGSLTVCLKKQHITVSNLPLAEGARVLIDGHDARLVDLKSRVGRQVSLRMDADPERNRVVGVACNATK